MKETNKTRDKMPTETFSEAAAGELWDEATDGD